MTENKEHLHIQEESYKKRIGKVTFLVTAYSNSCGRETSSQLILKMLEEKILNGKIYEKSKQENG